jgi:hypothetical protein
MTENKYRQEDRTSPTRPDNDKGEITGQKITVLYGVFFWLCGGIKMMSETEARIIKERCKNMGSVWGDMVEHHPKFTSYVEQLPRNYNDGEPLRCAVMLQEVFEDVRQWAHGQMVIEMLEWKRILST